MGDRITKLNVIAVILLIILVISVGFMLLNIWDRHYAKFPDQDAKLENTLTYNGTEYVLKENVETFLILGLDKSEEDSTSDSYNNDKQADFLMLLVFDNEEKQCKAIHINRDTMVPMDVLGVAGERIDTVIKQIALAHTYGNGQEVSCRNTADSVSSLLKGVNVNHYISVTMDAVAILNDLVDGVEVTVLDDFSGIDASLVKGEVVTLKGEQALTYVRTRAGLEDSSNKTRMKRQQQYLNALYEKFGDRVEADDEFVVRASVQMSEYMISDRSVTQLQELARKFHEYELVSIHQLEGETKLGEEFLEFYPNENSLMDLVVDCFYEAQE